VIEKGVAEQDEDRPDDLEIEALLDELEELEETTDSSEKRRVIRRTIDTLDRFSGGRIFGLDDLAQQIVGGFILSAPFVVTEEVWSLAASMNWLQWAVTVLMVIAIGYGTLYKADHERDAEREESIAGLPIRFVSLVLIAYLSVTILAFVFDAPETFAATPNTTLKAISIGAIFSVVGAATADSLF
jgi:uncharacterized membrane protein